MEKTNDNVASLPQPTRLLLFLPGTLLFCESRKEGITRIFILYGFRLLDLDLSILMTIELTKIAFEPLTSC